MSSVAQRRYNKRVIALSVAYAVALLGAIYLFKNHLLSSPLTYVAAVLPALLSIPISLGLGVMGFSMATMAVPGGIVLLAEIFQFRGRRVA